jgi:ATP-binding cassette subfamily B protein RaxB
VEDINLVIEPGEFVTIMGPSGGDKTTLVKVMLGLLEPTSGEVLIDGVPLPTIGARAFREQVAAVMQEDHLLSGSIADNICFFGPEYDKDRMIACARLAGIDAEIMAMPMTYNSLVGDMGSSLSEGQKQRVLLAPRSTATRASSSSTRAPPISTSTTSASSTTACGSCE